MLGCHRVACHSHQTNCLELSQQIGFTEEERAIYGALGGNLTPLLTKCTSWEDALWAHFRVLVDQSIEQELRSTPLMYRDQLAALPDYYDINLDPKNIFDELRASPTEVRGSPRVARGRPGSHSARILIQKSQEFDGRVLIYPAR